MTRRDKFEASQLSQGEQVTVPKADHPTVQLEDFDAGPRIRSLIREFLRRLSNEQPDQETPPLMLAPTELSTLVEKKTVMRRGVFTLNVHEDGDFTGAHMNASLVAHPLQLEVLRQVATQDSRLGDLRFLAWLLEDQTRLPPPVDDVHLHFFGSLVSAGNGNWEVPYLRPFQGKWVFALGALHDTQSWDVGDDKVVLVQKEV